MCARCRSTRLWSERDGFLFECADCGHQTSLTSGTLLEKTRKPFKTWFRAIFEISARRNGISAKDLQRIMGFRHNRRRTSGVTRIAARASQLVVRPPLTMRELIDDTRWYRKFAPTQLATA